MMDDNCSRVDWGCGATVALRGVLRVVLAVSLGFASIFFVRGMMILSSGQSHVTARIWADTQVGPYGWVDTRIDPYVSYNNTCN
jgi:hypothetical protein